MRGERTCARAQEIESEREKTEKERILFCVCGLVGPNDQPHNGACVPQLSAGRAGSTLSRGCPPRMSLEPSVARVWSGTGRPRCREMPGGRQRRHDGRAGESWSLRFLVRGLALAGRVRRGPWKSNQDKNEDVREFVSVSWYRTGTHGSHPALCVGSVPSGDVRTVRWPLGVWGPLPDLSLAFA